MAAAYIFWQMNQGSCRSTMAIGYIFRLHKTAVGALPPTTLFPLLSKTSTNSMDDPFVKDVDPSELDFAGEFLTSWLPFLTKGLCNHCFETLARRVRSLLPDSLSPDLDIAEPPSSEPTGCAHQDQEELEFDLDPNPAPISSRVRMSWVDMAQEEDELAESVEELEEAAKEGEGEGEGEGEERERGKVVLSREQREWIWFVEPCRPAVVPPPPPMSRPPPPPSHATPFLLLLLLILLLLTLLWFFLERITCKGRGIVIQN